jgi:hypothetical protein
VIGCGVSGAGSQHVPEKGLITVQPPDPAVISSYDAGGRAWPWVALAGLVTLPAVWAAVRGLIYDPGGFFDLKVVPVGMLPVLFYSYVWYGTLSPARRLELTVDTLRWRSTLRSHEIPLTELKRMRPARMGKAEVIEFARRLPIRVAVRDGLDEFEANVRAVAPHVAVTFADGRVGYRSHR